MIKATNLIYVLVGLKRVRNKIEKIQFIRTLGLFLSYLSVLILFKTNVDNIPN